jgi:hypothetical protein
VFSSIDSQQSKSVVSIALAMASAIRAKATASPGVSAPRAAAARPAGGVAGGALGERPPAPPTWLFLLFYQREISQHRFLSIQFRDSRPHPPRITGMVRETSLFQPVILTKVYITTIANCQ